MFGSTGSLEHSRLMEWQLLLQLCPEGMAKVGVMTAVLAAVTYMYTGSTAASMRGTLKVLK